MIGMIGLWTSFPGFIVLRPPDLPRLTANGQTNSRGDRVQPDAPARTDCVEARAGECSCPVRETGPRDAALYSVCLPTFLTALHVLLRPGQHVRHNRA